MIGKGLCFGAVCGEGGRWCSSSSQRAPGLGVGVESAVWGGEL